MSIHNKMRASTTGSATSSGSGDGENAAAAAVAADEASGAAKAPPGTTAPELPVVEAAAPAGDATSTLAVKPAADLSSSSCCFSSNVTLVDAECASSWRMSLRTAAASLEARSAAGPDSPEMIEAIEAALRVK